MASRQHALSFQQGFPDGFEYRDEIISPDQERRLIAAIKHLPFREFEFRGFLGKRRTVSFGWQYDFNAQELREAEQIPTFLLPLRARVAVFAGQEQGRFEHALVTEYSPGAAIGWHKDRPEFEDVIGISLGASCLFRFRRKTGMRWRTGSADLPPHGGRVPIGLGARYGPARSSHY